VLTEIGKLFHPLYHALAYILVFWYGLVPNYAVAISLFTVTVMVVLAPLTVKSTRSMLAMQRLQPEMNKLKEKYKNDKMAMQTEMSQLFKANGVNPAGGCLPMLLPLPVLIVLYRMILGLTKTVLVHKVRQVQPQYISHSSLLYKHLVAAHGAMMSFGVNLAKSATASHGSFLAALPFYAILVACIGLQFVQMRQLSSRAPKQTGAAAQTQAVMKFMPLIFGFIYLAIPAGVNVYIVVSSLFRIGQQELMYRFDPQVRGHVEAVKEAGRAEQGAVVRGAAKLSAKEAAPVGFFASLRAVRTDMGNNTGANGAARTAGGRSPTRSGAKPASGPTPRPGITSAARASTAKADGGGKPKAPPANGQQAKSRTTSAGSERGAAGSAGTQTPSGTRPKAARPKAVGPNSGGSISKQSSTHRPSTPSGGSSLSEQDRPAPNGAAPMRRQPAFRDPDARAAGPVISKQPSQRREKLSKDKSATREDSSTDSSWARQPREAATVAADRGRIPEPHTGAPKQPRGGADQAPNRSRAKRARRAR
jgi:YidC/Oxa1 family membrane protein insertase